jgi:DtxR family Mn-dependent transcriptional regulator
MIYGTNPLSPLQRLQSECAVKAPITISKEDYLKAILEAQSEGQTVFSSTLAHWLGVSAPAVTMALRRLKRDGYVAVKASGVVCLTRKGRQTAYRTARRHYLIERMLSEIFGMPWYRVHDEAERLEHAVSPAFEASLIERLGETEACPHGNFVLPESPAHMRKRGLVPLFDADLNTPLQIASMHERDPELLLLLHRRGLAPRAPIQVRTRSLNGTLSIETPSGTATLLRPAAEKIYVRRAPGKLT